MQEHEIVPAGFPRAAELCLMQVEQGLPVTTNVVTYTMIWDCRAQLQRVAGGCVVRGCEGVGGSSSAGVKAVRGCTLVKLGCGGMMCLYLKSLSENALELQDFEDC